MKFGRLLKTTSLDLPEMEALFSVYKSLKVGLHPGVHSWPGTPMLVWLLMRYTYATADTRVSFGRDFWRSGGPMA